MVKLDSVIVWLNSFPSERLRSMNKRFVFVVWYLLKSSLRKVLWVLRLSVEAGLLVTISVGLLTSVCVVVMCRRRLIDSAEVG